MVQFGPFEQMVHQSFALFVESQKHMHNLAFYLFILALGKYIDIAMVETSPPRKLNYKMG